MTMSLPRSVSPSLLPVRLSLSLSLYTSSFRQSVFLFSSACVSAPLGPADVPLGYMLLENGDCYKGYVEEEIEAC